MTDIEIRIAIAEACGWKIESHIPKYERVIIDPRGFEVEWHRFKDEPLRSIPDYPSDLNAMHEAVACAKDRYNEVESDSLFFCKASYIIYLNNILGRSHWDDEFDIVEATARQRAEAFLKTINKWEES